MFFLEVIMISIKKATNYFSKTEIAIWCSSVLLIVISFCAFDRENHLTLLASLVGVTSLISVAVCFATFFINDVYGYVSWQKMKLRQKQEG